MPIDTHQLDEAILGIDPAVAADSAGAEVDSVIVIPEAPDTVIAPFHTALDTAWIMQLTPAQMVDASTLQAIEEVPAWHSGLEPVERPIHPGKSTMFLSVIAMMFVVIAFNFRHLSRLLRLYGSELVKVRRGRDNVFDERPAADVRILILLIIQYIICGGILLAGGISAFTGEVEPGMMSPMGVARVSAIVGIYYLLELSAYQTVGYTFSTSVGRREWIRGFNSSIALLGVAMALPAVMVIFYPSTTIWMSAVGLLVYFVARLLFITKGIRIFYDKFSSLLYFILYLCTLEIIPLILVFKCSEIELI